LGSGGLERPIITPDQAQGNLGDKIMGQRLKQTYKDTIVPKLMEEFNYENAHQAPKVLKITVNRGLGEASQNAKALEASVKEIAVITGQKPVITRAKKAIAGFKIRQGMPVGVMVTLRAERMYAFLDRFINLALPSIRDFRGVSPKSFDGRGNYTIGLREQLIFPEINYDDVDQVRGMDISIITSANSDEEGRALLKAMGMPFRAS
jgi:large subunit ribosomal protein L5